MNISASNLPIQPAVTPQKVAGFSDSQLNVPSSVDSSSKPVSDTLSPSSSIPVNPTYAKPINAKPVVPNTTTNEAGNTANQADQQVAPDEQSPAQEASNEKSPDSPQLGNQAVYSEAELEIISSLKSRDAEVSAHERAHASVGGQHAGSPSYSYKTGPDGVKYAVSGEVSIDTSGVPGDPQATLQKAQQIKAAALAPAEPSGQDRKVAAQADQMASEARSDLLDSNSNSGGDSRRVSNDRNTNNAPEYFTGNQNLAINNDAESSEHIHADNHIDDATQIQMSERSFHINALYQNSASNTISSSFEIQA